MKTTIIYMIIGVACIYGIFYVYAHWSGAWYYPPTVITLILGTILSFICAAAHRIESTPFY